jgi:hypothetical protein
MPDSRWVDVGECGSCHARIRWALTGSGKRIPVDRDPVPDGNLFYVGDEDGPPTVAVITKGRRPPPGADRYTSHFATCPNAASHRRAR